MRPDVYLSYAPAGGGGVRLAVRVPGHPDDLVMLPLDRAGALQAAAGILKAAGVTRAWFEGGCLHVPGPAGTAVPGRLPGAAGEPGRPPCR